MLSIHLPDPRSSQIASENPCLCIDNFDTSITIYLMGSSGELIFVYLGKSLPSYGLASIELASRHSGLKVRLIGNASMARSLRNSSAKFIAVEDFYDEKEFKEASKGLSSSHSFRQGFWLKTLERFFVLEQYMERENLDSIFHAELDQLLFRADFLLSKLEEQEKQGLFLPFHTGDLAVSSVFYCNSKDALRSLLDFSSIAETFPNEMALIANWARENPEYVYPLPTMASIVNLSPSFPSYSTALNHHHIGGVVDASQLGLWVAGIDPRNVPANELPLTKYAAEPEESMLTRHQMEEIKFNFNPLDGFLNVNYGQKDDTKLFNLHIHSKIHKHLLQSDSSFEQIFYQANQNLPTLIPGVRRVQLQIRFAELIKNVSKNPQAVVNGLRRRLNKLLKRRPASFPYLSGDTFRSMADHIWEAGKEDLKPGEIIPGDVIFCQSHMLEALCERVLMHTSIPITLLLGNSDRNHTQSLGKLLADAGAVKTFAQNLADYVPGVEPLPIGLENAWHSTNGRPKDFRANRKNSQNRITRVMWAFNVETDPIGRKKAANDLVNVPTSDRLGLLTPKQHRSALTRYSFVASPPGNGLDCHRTWEAMYLGCVPIVLRSHMTQIYELMGLPVWVIDSFEELRDLTEEQLQARYVELSPKFETEAMWAKYWISRIRG